MQFQYIYFCNKYDDKLREQNCYFQAICLLSIKNCAIKCALGGIMQRINLENLEIVQLDTNNFNKNSLDNFILKQHVENCWRKINGWKNMNGLFDF